MFNRKLSRGVSKVQAGAMMAMAVLGVTSLAPRAHAATLQVANNATSLGLATDTGAYVQSLLPYSTDTVAFDSTLTSQFNFRLGNGTANSWLGIQVLNPAGNLFLNNDTWGNGFNVLTLSTGGIDMSAATVTMTVNTGLNVASSQTWLVGTTLNLNGTVQLNTNALTISGPGNVNVNGTVGGFVGGLASVTKSGMGTLTMSTQSTYTGATTIGDQLHGGGTLMLDFSGANAPSSNLLLGTGAGITFSTAALNVVGNANFPVSQTFSSMAFNYGLTTVTTSGNGQVTLNLGNEAVGGKIGGFNRGGAVRVMPNGTNSTFLAQNAYRGTGNTGIVEVAQLSSGVNAGGSYMTYGWSDFAVVNNGVICAPGSVQAGSIIYQGYNAGNIATNVNNLVDVQGGGLFTTDNNSVWEAVRFSQPGARTVTVTGTVFTGGVLVTPDVGASDIIIAGSSEIRPGRNSDLEIWQNNTQGNLIFGINVGYNTNGSMIKNGPGELILNASNSVNINRPLYINEGTVRISQGFAQAVYLEGGTLQIGASYNSGINNNQLQINGPGGALDVMGTNSYTMSNTIVGGATTSGNSFGYVGGLVKTGLGSLILNNTSAANTWSGGLNINGGLVQTNWNTATVSQLGYGPVNINNGGTLNLAGNYTGMINSNMIYVNSGGELMVNEVHTTSGFSYTNIAANNNSVVFAAGSAIGGTGTIGKDITISSGGFVSPGSNLTSGTINFNGLLSMAAGTSLNLNLATSLNSDDINMLTGSTLTLASGTGAIKVNLFDNFGTSYFSNGSYPLFTNVSGLTGGYQVLTNFTAGNFSGTSNSYPNANIWFYSDSVSKTIDVAIQGAKANAIWQINSGGNWWTAANWVGGAVPMLAGDSAIIGTKTTTGGTIAVNTNSFSMSVLGIDAGTNSGSTWTITATTGGKLNMDNGTNSAAINIGNGSQSISAPLSLLSPTQVTLNGGQTADALTISSVITTTGTGSTLTVVNTAGAATNGTANAFILTAAQTSTNLLTVATGATMIFATNGNWAGGSLVLSGNLIVNRGTYASSLANNGQGVIGNGTLTAGSGTLIYDTTASGFSGRLLAASGGKVLLNSSTTAFGSISVAAGGAFDFAGYTLNLINYPTISGTLTNSGGSVGLMNLVVAGAVATMNGYITLAVGGSPLNIMNSASGTLTMNGTAVGNSMGTVSLYNGQIFLVNNSAIAPGTVITVGPSASATAGLILGNNSAGSGLTNVNIQNIIYNDSTGNSGLDVLAGNRATLGGTLTNSMSVGTGSINQTLQLITDPDTSTNNYAMGVLTINGLVSTTINNSSGNIFLRHGIFVFNNATISTQNLLLIGRGSSTVTLTNSNFTSGVGMSGQGIRLGDSATENPTAVVFNASSSIINMGLGYFETYNNSDTTGTTSVTLTKSTITLRAFTKQSGRAGTILLDGTVLIPSIGGVFFGNSLGGGGGSQTGMTVGIGGGGANFSTSGFGIGAYAPFVSMPVSGVTDGGVTITGPGTLTLNSGGSNYNGLTRVSAGKFAAGANNAFSPNSVIYVYNTGAVLGGADASTVSYSEIVAGLDDTAGTPGLAKNFSNITFSPLPGPVSSFAGTLTSNQTLNTVYPDITISGGGGTQVLSGALTINNIHLGGSTTGVGTLILQDQSSLFAGSLTIGAGENVLVSQLSTNSSYANVSFGTITQRTPGGIGVFKVVGGTNGGSNGIYPGLTHPGFIDQGTFFVGATSSDYAFFDGSNYNLRAPVYGSDTGFAAPNTLAVDQHDFLTASIGTGAVEVNTIKMDGSGTLTQTTGSVLKLVNSGLLATGTGTWLITGGSISSTLASEVIVRVDATTETLNIGSSILDNATFGGTGLGVMTKSGAGSLILSAVNPFNGVLNIVNGTVVAANASALQNMTVNLVNLGGITNQLKFSDLSAAAVGGLIAPSGNSGTLSLTNLASTGVNLYVKVPDVLTPSNFTINTFGYTQTINAFYGNLTGSGSLTITSNNTDGRMDFNANASNTFTGGVTLLSGAITAWQQVQGTSMTANATYSNVDGSFGTGPVNLNGGTLTTHGDTNSAATFLNNFNVNGTGAYLNSLSNTTFAGNFGGNGTISRFSTLGSGGTVYFNGTASTFGGTWININNSVVSNNMSLTGNSAYSNWIFQNGGNFTINNDSTGGAVNFGTLQGSQSGNTLTINFAGSTASTYVTTLNLGASNIDSTLAGNITYNGNGTNNTFAFAKQGTGMVALGGANNFGVLNVNGGTLGVASLDNGAMGTAGGTVTMAAGTTLQFYGTGNSTSTRRFNLGGNVTIDASGTGSANFSNSTSMSFTNAGVGLTVSLVGNGTGNITNNITYLNTLGAQISNNGAGVVSLIKDGPGTWALTGTANSYTGGTTVNNGTLLLTNTKGEPLGTGAVTVTGNGALAGNGLTSAPVTINAYGTLTAGTFANDLQTLQFGGTLAMQANSILSVQMTYPGIPNNVSNIGFVNGTNSQLILPSGSNKITVNLYNTLATTSYFYNGTFNIFTGIAGTTNLNYVTSHLANMTIGNEIAGGSFLFSTSTLSGGAVILTISNAWANGIWTAPSSGTWTTVSNWSGGIPNASGNLANFLSYITTGANVALGGGQKVVSGMFFNSTWGYTIAPTSAESLLFVPGTTTTGLIQNSAGTNTITADIHLGSVNNLSPLTALNVNTLANSVTRIQNLISDNGTVSSLTLTGSGTLVVTGTATPGGGTYIPAGSNLVIGNGATGALNNSVEVDGVMGVNFATAKNFAINNILTSSTSGTLAQYGSGTLTLQGTGGAYLPGSLLVAAGTVKFGQDFITSAANTNANDTTSGYTGLVMNNGILDVSGHSEAVMNVSNNNTNSNMWGTITSSGSPAGTLYLSQSGNSTYNGQFAGNINLVKNGNGNLTLGGNSSSTGTLTITNNGTVSNTGQLIVNNTLGTSVLPNTSMGALILMACNNTTSAGLLLGPQPVNLTTPVVLSAYNGNTQSPLEFISTQGTNLATLSGNVTIDTAGDPTGAIRLGNINGGTLTFAGNIAIPSGVYGSISRGNVNLDGHGTIQDNNTDPSNPFIIGSGDSTNAINVPRAVTFVMQGSSSLYTAISSSPAIPFTAIKLGYFGTSAVNSVNTTMTIAGNAYVEVGPGGVSNFDIQASPLTSSTAYNVLNLNGGSIKLGQFKNSGDHAFGSNGITASDLAPRGDVIINGGTIIAGLDGVDMTPGFNTSYNTRFAIGTGGMTLDLNGTTALQFSKQIASNVNSGADGGLTYISSSAPGTITLSTRHLYGGPTTIGTGATVIVNSTVGGVTNANPSDLLGNPVFAGPVNFAGGNLLLGCNMTLGTYDGGTVNLQHNITFSGSVATDSGLAAFQLFNGRAHPGSIALTPTAYISGGALELNGMGNSSGSALLTGLEPIAGPKTNYTAQGFSLVAWFTPGATQGTNSTLFYIGGATPRTPGTAADPTGIIATNGYSFFALQMYQGNAGASQNNSRILINPQSQNSGNNLSFTGRSPALDGNQHMIVVSIDTNLMSYYVDGNFSGSVALTDSNGGNYLMDLVDTGSIDVGGSGFTADQGFNGTINDMRVYNTALSPNYISQMVINGSLNTTSTVTTYRNVTVTRGTNSGLNLAGNQMIIGGAMNDTGTGSVSGTLSLMGGAGSTLTLMGNSSVNINITSSNVHLLIGNGTQGVSAGTVVTGGSLLGGSITNAVNTVILFNRTDNGGILGANIGGGTLALVGSGTTTVTSPFLNTKFNFTNGGMIVAAQVAASGGFAFGSAVTGLGFVLSGDHPSALNITNGFVNGHSATKINMIAPVIGTNFDVGNYTVITGAGGSLINNLFTTPAVANGYQYKLLSSVPGQLVINVGLSSDVQTYVPNNQLYWVENGVDHTFINAGNWSTDPTLSPLAGMAPTAPVEILFNASRSSIVTLTTAGIQYVHDVSFGNSGPVTINGTLGTFWIQYGMTMSSTSGSVIISTGQVDTGWAQTWANNSTNGIMTVSANVVASSLTLAGGTGGILLGGNNTFSTGVLVQGLVQAGNANAFGGATGTVVIDSTGRLDLNNTNNVQLHNLSGAGTITNGATSSITAIISGLAPMTYAGNISSPNGAISLNLPAGNTLTLTGTNSYTGTTTVAANSSGTSLLVFGGPSAMAPAAALNVGGIVDMGGYNGTASNLSGAGTLTTTSGSALLNINSGANGTFSGLISGNMSLLKTGGSDFNITNTANTYVGNTIVNAGRLLPVSSAFLPYDGQVITPLGAAGSTITLNTGGTLYYIGAGGGNYQRGYMPYNIVMNGGTYFFQDGGTQILAASDTTAYTLTITGAGNIMMNEWSDKPLTIAGPIQGNGTITLTETSGGRAVSDGFYFTNTSALNTFSGTIIVDTTSNSGAFLSPSGPAIFANAIINTGVGSTQNVGPIAFTAGYGNATVGGLTGSGLVGLVDTLGLPITLAVGGTAVSSTFNGVLSGAGSLIKMGTGTLVLASMNTFTGTPVVVVGGTLQIGNGGIYGSIDNTVPVSVIVNAGATLAYKHSDVVLLTNAISGDLPGDGTLLQAGGGTLILDAANSYGATTIAAGTLQVGNGDNGATLGSGPVTNNSVLAFNVFSNSPLVVSNAISGFGQVNQIGAGSTVVLSGANNYSGSTTISAGAIQVGDGSNGGIGSGTILDNSLLTFYINGANLNVAGALSGNGTLTQLGTGTTTFTSAANFVGGTTSITTGTLAFGGGVTHNIGAVSGAGALQVNAGTTLKSKAVNVGSLAVNGTQVFQTSSGVSTVTNLTLAGSGPSNWTGLLDLTNNPLIVHNGGNVAGQIKQAMAGGLWNGTAGITSSTVVASLSTTAKLALGYATGAEYSALNSGSTTFAGQPIVATDELVKPVLVGDASLDGTVNFSDFLAMLGTYNHAGDWTQGDFNGDGAVNFTDFLAMLGNYNHTYSPAPIVTDQAPSLSPALGGGTMVSASVPEPASLAVLALGTVGLLSRRRRRR